MELLSLLFGFSLIFFTIDMIFFSFHMSESGSKDIDGWVSLKKGVFTAYLKVFFIYKDG